MVMVRIPTALQRYADGREHIEVEAATVGAALSAACSDHPDLCARLLGEDGVYLPHLAVFRGETGVERADASTTPVLRGDVVAVLIGITGGAHDVRMKGFRDRATVDEALAVAMAGIGPLPGETLPATGVVGRVLTRSIVSGVDVPAFRRATMDGYAVRSEDTFGASAYAPIPLRIEGETMPGRRAPDGPAPGAAIRIMTGAPLPTGADAVLRAEDASELGELVEVRAPAAPGRNVGRIGEDVEAGSAVLAAGRRLQPQDVGLMAAIGAGEASVHRRPLVRVIVSGDELLAPGQVPAGTSIVDSNSPMLQALIERDGGIPFEVLRLPDGREPMKDALSRPGADVIITAGAASVGREDHTPGLVDELGTLLIHGVAMRPSSPTGIGRIDGRPVFLLPGNPVSCMVAYDFFAGPAIRVLGGGSFDWPYPVERLPLAGRLVSQIGRTDYARVVVSDGLVEPLAVGGASVLSSITRADGFVIIPPGSEGYAAGVEIEVGLYGGAS